MTEREIEAFEKQLKAVPLAPLSGAFFANVAKRIAEETEDDDLSLEADFGDLADVEAALRRMTPIAPSQSFFEKVEAGLADDATGEIVFPKKERGGILMSLMLSIMLMATSLFTTLKTISFSVSMVIPKIVLGLATEPLAFIMVAPVAPAERAISTIVDAKPAFTMIYNAFNSFIFFSLLKHKTFY